MNEQAFIAYLTNMVTAVALCAERRLTTPALILLYSGIDSVGWLDNPARDANSESFQAWVDRYLLPVRALPCNSRDLYAARCGVLHTYSPDSALAHAGRARRIYYAWGQSTSAELSEMIRAVPGEDALAIHFDELLAAWQSGLVAFLDDLSTDPVRRDRVHEKAEKMFGDRDRNLHERVAPLLQRARGKSNRSES